MIFLIPCACYMPPDLFFRALEWCRHTAYGDKNAFASTSHTHPLKNSKLSVISTSSYSRSFGGTHKPMTSWTESPHDSVSGKITATSTRTRRFTAALFQPRSVPGWRRHSQPGRWHHFQRGRRRHAQLDRRWYSQVGRLHLLIFCRAEERAMRTLVQISMHC